MNRIESDRTMKTSSCNQCNDSRCWEEVQVLLGVGSAAGFFWTARRAHFEIHAGSDVSWIRCRRSHARICLKKDSPRCTTLIPFSCLSCVCDCSWKPYSICVPAGNGKKEIDVVGYLKDKTHLQTKYIAACDVFSIGVVLIAPCWLLTRSVFAE